jgi:hypothetical protein
MLTRTSATVPDVAARTSIDPVPGDHPDLDDGRVHRSHRVARRGAADAGAVSGSGGIPAGLRCAVGAVRAGRAVDSDGSLAVLGGEADGPDQHVQ